MAVSNKLADMDNCGFFAGLIDKMRPLPCSWLDLLPLHGQIGRPFERLRMPFAWA